MSVSILLLIVCVAGAVGGIVNALMTDNGFIMPSKAAASSGSILRPGFIGNADRRRSCGYLMGTVWAVIRNVYIW
jgi:hypothetical protein